MFFVVVRLCRRLPDLLRLAIRHVLRRRARRSPKALQRCGDGAALRGHRNSRVRRRAG